MIVFSLVVCVTVAIMLVAFVILGVDDEDVRWAIFVCVVFLVAFSSIVASITTADSVSQYYYKRGQVDVLNGNAKYHLVKQPSGETIYEEIK
ncbi:MAG: hypothetical protein WCY05_06275 [Candidatus Omnitrophota bacterium]